MSAFRAAFNAGEQDGESVDKAEGEISPRAVSDAPEMKLWNEQNDQDILEPDNNPGIPHGYEEDRTKRAWMRGPLADKDHGRVPVGFPLVMNIKDDVKRNLLAIAAATVADGGTFAKTPYLLPWMEEERREGKPIDSLVNLFWTLFIYVTVAHGDKYMSMLEDEQYDYTHRVPKGIQAAVAKSFGPEKLWDRDLMVYLGLKATLYAQAPSGAARSLILEQLFNPPPGQMGIYQRFPDMRFDHALRYVDQREWEKVR